ncbi:MAG: DUF2723 domain-containing protein [Anaerolineales bacterium]|nr:DUF2723 domain-containing protein [Anaerolineales bacterium]
MTRLDRFLAIAVFIITLAVYALTLTPSLSYLSPDGSELATVPYVLGLAHSPGYPLYTWLGFLFSRLVPLGDAAYRINLMSAVMGALAAAGVYWILIRTLPESLPLPWRRAAAALPALLLAFSKTFWAQSLIAEVYAPNAAGIAITLIALLRWERTRRRLDFFLFALAFGLSLGLHLSDLGFAPAFILFILLCLFEPVDKHGGAPETMANVNARPASASPAPNDTQHPGRSLLSVVILGLLGFSLGAAQFLWLPFRAATLIDRAMLRSAPTTPAGIYNYTLGAFPSFKFAFPLTALPDRLVIYLDLLNQQFGLIGIGLGIVGLFSLLARRTRHFFLLVGMYLVEIWFFIQYSAFDLDVFFIPAHLLWAVFIGFGLFEIIRAAQWLLAIMRAAAGRPNKTKPITALAGCMMILFAAVPLRNNWAANDFSKDTAVNDFYAGVWSVLPENSALVTQSGVFGYDAFYWQLVYNTRADVLLPLLPGPNPSAQDFAGRDLFTTTRAMTGNQGPGALPADLLKGNYWSIPVLFGQQPEESFGRRETLVLYHLTADPPPLLEAFPDPQFIVEETVGPAQLLGFDLSTRRIESGDILYVKFYWRMIAITSFRVETRLGDLTLEQHEIGLGLLGRYSLTVPLPPGSVISDSFALVIPSGTAPGAYAFTLRPAGIGSTPGTAINLATVDVINETGTMERWLQIAGK